MPEDFRSSFLKLDRAKAHFDELRALLKTFMDQQTFVAEDLTCLGMTPFLR
jgi:hypothetical protein